MTEITFTLGLRSSFVRVLLGLFPNCEKRLLSLSCLYVGQSVWNNSVAIGRILMKFDILVFLKNLEKIQVSLKWTRLTGTSHEHLCPFVIISR
jgi:hypothetical protein